MGKQGPCCHCGVTSTPLWRNGPPEKPVLCNACGSRWRTKGTLANYTPLHARLDPDEYEDHRTRVKTISLKRREEKLNKRKLSDSATDGDYAPDYSLGFQKNLDEDTSNRSSSGSAVSNSESCAQFGSGDASDLTGPAQSIVWDGLVPSKKRTCVTRPKQSSVEKLTKDLHTILHEQASHFSSITEEDLLFESEAPMGSVEFGHGSVLIRHPRSLAKEEESEASSLSVDIKLHRPDEGYTTPASMVSLSGGKSLYTSSSQAEKVKKINGQIVKLEQAKRDKSSHEKLQILLNHESLLHQIDLSEIANSDVFWGHLTVDEQQGLLKYLPPIDTSTLSDGLKSMFDSPYFMENLSSFQKLLAEGVLDASLPGVKTEDYKVVKGLALSNLTKSKWVELYNMMKDKKGKKSTGECVTLSGSKSSSSVYVAAAKNFQDSQNHVFSEAKTTSKVSKRVTIKGGHKGKDTTPQNESSCFTPTSRNLFALQTDGNSLMLDSLQFEDESSDQDLLLDIPSNSSFPEAELLHPGV